MSKKPPPRGDGLPGAGEMSIVFMAVGSLVLVWCIAELALILINGDN